MSDAESADADELDFGALLEEAEDCLTNVEDCLGGVENLENLENDTLEELLGDVETLARVATEAEDLIEAIDFSELPEAVNGDELLEAIEIGEIPDVLADEDAGATDLVNFTQLFRAINLLNAWDATDLGDLWQEKQELEDAVDALGDGEDAGMVEDAISDITDDDGSLLGGDDDDDGDLLETDLGAEEAKNMLGSPDPAEDPEAYQVFIQQQAMKGIDAFRSALLETHEKFEQLYEFNRERMRRQDMSTNSRNPTASSTVPVDRRDLGGGARYSTVPQSVKYSTAPTRKRIYGRRFEIEREKQRRRNQEEQRRRNQEEQRQRTQEESRR
ncbi:hypothetical protein [Halopiger xanaduensis]|uniref:Uncharacterized protein n=1 Tax=Halopiger xanaduensis (strain DSM 18323 / JCM 14033 / SH-6) TaxID=797210 RepID=F8D730_HALXS|nr:hypothetical protein [Halopiger xanaduensis]AEH35465.1 hypothetical protein Halxa_0826 [Halopiger xanaduensis SH-6]